MPQPFTNRVVMVTGALRGIGRACALEFAQRDAHVAINDVVDHPEGEQIIRQINAHGGTAKIYHADVGDARAVEQMVKQMVRDFGRLDVLVNNAAVIHARDFFALTPADWEKILRVNLIGAAVCCQHAARVMRDQPTGGSIVNIASTRGFPHGTRDVRIDYSASKAALINLTASLAKVLAPAIRVNAVAPGATTTDMNADWPEARKEMVTKAIPIGRMNTPEDVAKAVVFLASDDAATITGQTLVVDGGGLLCTPC